MNADSANNLHVSLDSTHRSSVADINNSRVVFPVDFNLGFNPHNTLLKIAVTQFSFANTFYNIPENDNILHVMVYFDDTDFKEVSVEIPAGYYSANGMASALSSLAALGALHTRNAEDYGLDTCVFNPNTGKLEWTWKGSGYVEPPSYYAIRLPSTANGDTFLQSLGLTASVNPHQYVRELPTFSYGKNVALFEPGVKLASPYMYDARRYKSLQISLPHMNFKHFSSVPFAVSADSPALQQTAALFTVPVVTNFGETQLYEPARPRVVYSDRVNVNALEVLILDGENHQPVNFRDNSWRLELAIEVVPVSERAPAITDQDTPFTQAEAARVDSFNRFKRTRVG